MASDITAPTLHNLVLSDTTIDLDHGETGFVVTAHFSDDLSGVFDGFFANGSGGAAPQIHFVSSTGQIASGIFDIAHPVSGTTLNGVFQATVTFASFAEAGTWRVKSLLLNDEAGNSRLLEPGNSPLLASKTVTVVNANSDTAPPQLQSISLDDTTIDIDGGQTTVTVTAHLTDNVSGLFDFTSANGTLPVIAFISPSGQLLSAPFDIAHPVSGTSTDGFFKATVTFGPFAERGTWKVYSMVLNDKARNGVLLDPAQVPLLAATTFTVTNANSDAAPPTLKSIALGQPAFNAADGTSRISVTARFTDNLSSLFDGIFPDGSGGAAPQIHFQSSTGQIVSGVFDILHPLSGDRLDGIFATTLILGPFAEAGTWRLRSLLISDEAGNKVTLGRGDLPAPFSNTFVLGSNRSEQLVGTSRDDSLFGYAGNDTLTAGAGNDTVDGGAGSDVIVGGSGAGNDRYAGGAGVDTVKYTSATHKITVALTPKGSAAYGVASGSDIGRDKLVSIENIIGGKGGDEIVGNGLANRLSGDAGNDTLRGLGGNDTLLGGAGDDTLTGSAGDDEITGGRGRDTLTGGAGDDDFNFKALNELGKTAATRDLITDFVHARDDIDLSAIDASTKKGGDQKFTFIGTAAFHATAGELRFFKQNPVGTANDKTIVEGDVNGDGKADFQIELKGLKALTGTDFIL